VAEVFVQFTEPVIAPNGRIYYARACGSEMPVGLWQGWIEFEPALERALKLLGRTPRPAPVAVRPTYDGPADDRTPPPAAESILNPFSVYRKGEALLRSQLSALSAWHLVNIIRAHELSDLDPAVLDTMDAPVLVELIVTAVRSLMLSPD
jgi:hypothetical protein